MEWLEARCLAGRSGARFVRAAGRAVAEQLLAAGAKALLAGGEAA